MGSNQYTKPSTNYKSIKFGVDLADLSRKQLVFLKEVNKHPSLCEGAVVTAAIRRYEKLWLPLVAKHGDKNLVPPLDIHWIWHCHLLAPYHYEKDTKTLVGTVPDHKVFGDHAYQKALQSAERLWLTEYPDEAFEVDLSTSSGVRVVYQSQCKYDLQAAVSRQRKFYYQVSLPHFGDEEFLKTAVKRYKMYLTLKKLNTDAFLVPCYDFDLVWHSHQLNPLVYKRDTTAILGKMFNHDDSVDDRAPDSKLNRCDEHTRKLWRDTFGEECPVSGCMYRGDTPFGELHLVTPDQVMAVSSKIADITVNSVKVQNPIEEMNSHFMLKLNLSNNRENAWETNPTVLKLNGPETEWGNATKGITTFRFDTRKYTDLQFELIDKRGFLCFSSDETYGLVSYPMGSVVDSTPPSGKTVEPSMELSNGYLSPKRSANAHDTNGSPLTVSFSASVDPPNKGPCILYLRPGEFATVTMPESIKQLWGPIPLPRLPPDVPNTCIVASHRLFNHTQEVQFTCRIAHSVPLMMSAVQVFCGDKMAAVSHLVGQEQLPTEDQLSSGSKYPVLDPKTGERAMLIKDYWGDWGIVIGKWDGYQKGTPGIPGVRRTSTTPPRNGKPGVPGNPGHLYVKFYNLRTRFMHPKPILKNRTNFQIENINVDLKMGTLEILEQELAQNVCLGFSIAVLHVLCQPRPQDTEGRPVQRPKTNGPKEVRGFESESLGLIVAAGYLEATPCNSYIKSTVGAGSCAGCGCGDVAGCAGCAGCTGGCGGGCGASCGAGCGGGCGGCGG